MFLWHNFKASNSVAIYVIEMGYLSSGAKQLQFKKKIKFKIDINKVNKNVRATVILEWLTVHKIDLQKVGLMFVVQRRTLLQITPKCVYSWHMVDCWVQ